MSSYNFKVVLLGQGCVGKTSLVLRYVSDVFNDSHQSTLQASFLKKQLYLDQDLVRLNIWDTAGQEKFHALGPIYYREANGALLVYDVTNPDSLRKVRDWIRELNKMLGIQNIRLAIVGNKVDLLARQSGAMQQQQPQGAATPAPTPTPTTATTNPLAPSSSDLRAQRSAQGNALVQEAMQLAEELLNARHYLTSAKQNQGIGELFVSLARRMVEQHKRLSGPQPGAAALNARLLRRTISLASEPPEEQRERGAQVSMMGANQRSKRSNNDACQC